MQIEKGSHIKRPRSQSASQVLLCLKETNEAAFSKANSIGNEVNSKVSKPSKATFERDADSGARHKAKRPFKADFVVSHTFPYGERKRV